MVEIKPLRENLQGLWGGRVLRLSQGLNGHLASYSPLISPSFQSRVPGTLGMYPKPPQG